MPGCELRLTIGTLVGLINKKIAAPPFSSSKERHQELTVAKPLPGEDNLAHTRLAMVCFEDYVGERWSSTAQADACDPGSRH